MSVEPTDEEVMPISRLYADATDRMYVGRHLCHGIQESDETMRAEDGQGGALSLPDATEPKPSSQSPRSSARLLLSNSCMYATHIAEQVSTHIRQQMIRHCRHTDNDRQAYSHTPIRNTFPQDQRESCNGSKLSPSHLDHIVSRGLPSCFRSSHAVHFLEHRELVRHTHDIERSRSGSGPGTWAR